MTTLVAVTSVAIVPVAMARKWGAPARARGARGFEDIDPGEVERHEEADPSEAERREEADPGEVERREEADPGEAERREEADSGEGKRS